MVSSSATPGSPRRPCLPPPPWVALRSSSDVFKMKPGSPAQRNGPAAASGSRVGARIHPRDGTFLKAIRPSGNQSAFDIQATAGISGPGSRASRAPAAGAGR